jgi:hypothetical protein
VVWTRLLQELLEVVRGRPRLTLATARNSQDMRHAGAVRSLVVTTVIVECNCSLLKSLLGPLPATLGALPSVLGDDFGRRPLLLLEVG